MTELNSMFLFDEKVTLLKGQTGKMYHLDLYLRPFYRLFSNTEPSLYHKIERIILKKGFRLLIEDGWITLYFSLCIYFIFY